MSVAKIKEEMKRLSKDELVEIEMLASELRKNATEESRVREIRPDDPGVSERMDAVLQKHHNLLRRLAQ